MNDRRKNSKINLNIKSEIEVKDELMELEEDEQQNEENLILNSFEQAEHNVSVGIRNDLVAGSSGRNEDFCSEKWSPSDGYFGSRDRSSASVYVRRQQAGSEASFQIESNSKPDRRGNLTSRQISSVWYHFTIPFINEKRAKCNYCNFLMSFAGGSTGNLYRHLKGKHPTVPVFRTLEHRSRSPLTSEKETDIEPRESPSSSQQEIEMPSTSLQTEQRIASFPSPSTSAVDNNNSSQLATSETTLAPSDCQSRFGQVPMSRYVGLIKTIPKHKKMAIDIQVTKMICKEYLPFRIVNSKEFKKFVNMLRPGYDLPCRKTISKDLLPSLYKSASDELQVKLSEATAICITCDGWTSVNNSRFYSVSAHYVDNDMKLNSNLVECSEFFQRHTAANIGSWLDDVLKKWKIKDKITAAVTDNEEDIKAAIDALSIRHISCYAHSLNLIVQNALDRSIRDILNKVKTVVQYFKRSSSASGKLHEMQINLNKSRLKLIQDVPTRWNSTFEMLKSVLTSKLSIISTLTFLQPNDLPNLEASEWEVLEHVVSLLKFFEEVMFEISSEKNVSLTKTCVLSRGMVKKIKIYLKKEREQRLPTEINCFGKNLLEELDQRFGNRENTELISQAIFLDPRFKKLGFGDQERFKATYDALAEKIRCMEATLPSQPTNNIQPEPQKPSDSVWDDFDETMEQLKTSSNPMAAAIVELDKYLAEETLTRTSDPLEWWNEKKKTYLNLYELARRRLCIPATSVPCEKLFTKEGQILTAKRSKLESSRIPQIVFLNENFE